MDTMAIIMVMVMGTPTSMDMDINQIQMGDIMSQTIVKFVCLGGPISSDGLGGLKNE